MKICIFSGTKNFASNYNIQIFIINFISRSQPAEILFYKEIRQVKAGQNNRYDTTKTLRSDNLIINLWRLGLNQKTNENISVFLP